jgi:hypothetical protein
VLHSPAGVHGLAKSPKAAELQQERQSSILSGSVSSGEFCVSDYCLDNHYPASFLRTSPAIARHTNYRRLEGEVNLDFKYSSVVHNNLGNQGPDGGEQLLRFENVTTIGDQIINLVVTSTSPFRSLLPKRTGESNHWGIINFECDTGADFLFQFKDTNTHEEVMMDKFYFSVISAGVGASTSVSYVHFKGNLSAYFMTDDSVWQAVSDASTMWETSLGGSDEVPADPQNMNPGELSRTFTGMFEKVASFEAGLGVLPNPASDCSSETDGTSCSLSRPISLDP